MSTLLATKRHWGGLCVKVIANRKGQGGGDKNRVPVMIHAGQMSEGSLISRKNKRISTKIRSQQVATKQEKTRWCLPIGTTDRRTWPQKAAVDVTGGQKKTRDERWGDKSPGMESHNLGGVHLEQRKNDVLQGQGEPSGQIKTDIN